MVTIFSGLVGLTQDNSPFEFGPELYNPFIPMDIIVTEILEFQPLRP